MDTKRMMWVAVVLAMILSHHVSAGYCTEELMGAEGGAHVVVSSCSNVGTFSLGGFYEGKWERLTYNYPDSWGGTFISVYVDGRVYSNTLNPSSVRLDSSTLMDKYVEKPPHRVNNKIITSWLLPENVVVEEVFELIENGTEIQIKLTNKGKQEANAGVRLHLDTMLGENDGAPIYIPGDGLKSKESEYYGDELDFEYWKAYNRGENATIISSGVLYSEGLTYPDKLLVTDWKKSMYSSWDYNVDPEVTILGDSAVLIYYSPRILLPGETMTISTVYKKGEPVLPSAKGPLGIADIVPEYVGGAYLPGENISLSVDVVSREMENNTSVLMEVVDSEGNVVYAFNATKGLLEPDTVTPTEFGFQVPENLEEGDFFDVRASLFKDGKRVDEKSRRFSVSESHERGLFRLNDIRATMSDDFLDIEVDVVGSGLGNSGILRIQVIKDGEVVYETARPIEALNDATKTQTFRWFHGGIALDSFIVIATLHKDYRKVDEIRREFSFQFRLKDVRVVDLKNNKATIEVDLVSSKVPDSGEVRLEIFGDGVVVHESMRSTGIVPPYMTSTVNFTWIFEDKLPESVFASVSLYKNSRKIDEITKELSFKPSVSETTESTQPSSPLEYVDEGLDEGEDRSGYYLQFLGLTLLILLVLFLNPTTREKALDAGSELYGEIEKRRQREDSISKLIEIVKEIGVGLKIPEIMKELKDIRSVELEKLRDGENIVLIIKNRSNKKLRNCVVEDSLPKGASVSMSDFHVIGKGNKLVVSRDDRLIWRIGDLMPKDTAILEYRMTGGGNLTSVRLRWDFGEKIVD